VNSSSVIEVTLYGETLLLSSVYDALNVAPSSFNQGGNIGIDLIRISDSLSLDDELSILGCGDAFTGFYSLI